MNYSLLLQEAEAYAEAHQLPVSIFKKTAFVFLFALYATCVNQLCQFVVQALQCREEKGL